MPKSPPPPIVLTFNLFNYLEIIMLFLYFSLTMAQKPQLDTSLFYFSGEDPQVLPKQVNISPAWPPFFQISGSSPDVHILNN